MADVKVTTKSFAAVTLPGIDCKMQVHGAPVVITFTAAGNTQGLRLEPGDVIPIQAAHTMRARRVTEFNPTLSFEVF